MGFFRNLFRRGTGSGFVMPSTGTAFWPERNYHNFAKEAYLKCVISYRCINEIAQSVSSVPWKMFEKKGNKRQEVTEHPIIDLVTRPNPEDGQTKFMYGLTAFLVLDGNAYVERIGPSTGPNAGVPKEIYNQRPDQIKPVIDDNNSHS